MKQYQLSTVLGSAIATALVTFYATTVYCDHLGAPKLLNVLSDKSIVMQTRSKARYVFVPTSETHYIRRDDLLKQQASDLEKRIDRELGEK